ncbi:MAG: hypothetical protein ACKOBM_08910, partial [Gammaproteobacteria bacterium]
MLKTVALMLLTLGLHAVARADDAADVAAIDQLYADWRKAVESADIDGYVAVLDTNVRLLPPDAEAIVGAENY